MKQRSDEFESIPGIGPTNHILVDIDPCGEAKNLVLHMGSADLHEERRSVSPAPACAFEWLAL
jgi:hypothetical protein